MYNHAPKDYDCPICAGLDGGNQNKTLIRETDFIYRDEHISSIINSFFIPGNEGHVIIIPNRHYENIYELPENVGYKIIEFSKKVAKALKLSYKCDGITILQNNEPASEQHAFHYHMHIIPRYTNDEYHKNRLIKLTPSPEERKSYADKLKQQL